MYASDESMTTPLPFLSPLIKGVIKKEVGWSGLGWLGRVGRVGCVGCVGLAGLIG